MIKLQDFATKYGVTDRQVQRLLKKHEEEMSGHFERQGTNGTWIDETGEKILRSKMRQAPVVLHDTDVGKKIEQLKGENEILKDKLILALEKIQEQQNLLDAAEQTRLALEAAKAEQKAQAEDFAARLAEISSQETEERLARIEAEARVKELEAELAKPIRFMDWLKGRRKGGE